MSTRRDHRARAVLALGRELNALLTASRAFVSELGAAFDPPLPSASFQLLQYLHAFGPSRASQLAEALAMDKSAVSRLVRQLAALDLVASEQHESDGRGVTHRLTGGGSAKIERSLADKGARFLHRLEPWPVADIEALARLLHRFNAGEPGAP